MTLRLRWLQLDVFSDRLFAGNPLAVVIDAGALDGAQMQRIARWTNLSETAFLLPPTQAAADYRVRIFTPRQELPFAGHPSVGSAYAAIEAGCVDAGKTALIQQCAAGLLAVQVSGHGARRVIHVQAPPAQVRGAAAVSQRAPKTSDPTRMRTSAIRTRGARPRGPGTGRRSTPRRRWCGRWCRWCRADSRCPRTPRPTWRAGARGRGRAPRSCRGAAC